MIEDFIGDATQRMDKTVDATQEHFNSVRTTTFSFRTVVSPNSFSLSITR